MIKRNYIYRYSYRDKYGQLLFNSENIKDEGIRQAIAKVKKICKKKGYHFISIMHEMGTVDDRSTSRDTNT